MGMRGMSRMNGKTERVANEKDCALDRRRSVWLWILTGFLTLIFTGLAVVFHYP